MFTKNFWREATERAVKTAAQFAVAAWGTAVFTTVGEVISTGEAIGLAAIFGAGLSYLTSLATSGIGEKDDPSAIKEKP